jgi:hypothetical protein
MIFVALVLGVVGNALAQQCEDCDWVVTDTQEWDRLPTNDGGKLCINAGGNLRINDRSKIENNGEVCVGEGGKLNYRAYRLDMNDGTITMLGGLAEFHCGDGIKAGDDYGPSNMNILGGVMWAERIEGRFNRDNGRV